MQYAVLNLGLILFTLTWHSVYCAPGNLEFHDLEESELDLLLTLFSRHDGIPSVSPDIRVFEVGNNQFGNLTFTDMKLNSTNDLDNAIIPSGIPHHKLKIGKQYRRHIISKRALKESTSKPKSPDYVDKQRAIAKGRGIGGTADGGSKEIEVEVGAVFDYANSKLFKFDPVKITEYLSVLLNGVNVIYTNLENPKVSFKLTGVYIIKDEKSQAFIDESKSNNTEKNTVDLMKLLDNYARWVKKNMKDLPKHDVIPLVTAVTPQTYSFGLAYLSGACWSADPEEDKAMTASINIDVNGIFDAVFTLAHEFGHLLGSSHDGEGTSSGCPWADGYVMSYEGWGKKNKFQFSECSKTAIQTFVSSPAANCLFTKNAEKYEKVSDKFDGDIILPGELCPKLTGIPAAQIVQDDIDKFCKVVRCEYIENGTRIWRSFDRAPGIHKFPCGIGGYCHLGECVGTKEDPTEGLDLNTKCATLTRNPNATLFIEDDANMQCRRVKCKIQQRYKNLNSTSTQIMSFEVKPLDHSFPCGLLGHCMNGSCEGNQENPDDKLNLNKICQKRTGKQDARTSSEDLTEDQKCKILRCKIQGKDGTKYSLMTFPSPAPLENSFPCNGEKGKCVAGKCVE